MDDAAIHRVSGDAGGYAFDSPITVSGMMAWGLDRTGEGGIVSL